MLQPPPAPPTAAIVITAKALSDPASERAFSVTRLTRRDLADAPSHALDQVLGAVPGLELFRRSDSHSGHPTSQGVTLRGLGGTASSRALVVLDGVPQSDPFGGWINWPAYDPASLAEVRVVRGGGSVGFGPGALAGTIDMTSSFAEGLRATAEVGSRNSVSGAAYLGLPLGPGTVSVSARAERSDGFILISPQTRGPADHPAPYRDSSARAIWAAPIGATVELQASVSAFRDRRNRGLDFTDNRTDGADGSLRLVGRGRWQWSALGYGQWRKLTSSFASVDSGRSVATRVSLQDAVPSHGFGGAVELRPPVGSGVELRIGTDARRTDGESRELYAYSAGEPQRRRVAGGKTLTAGLFTDASAVLGRVTLSGGARVDHWRISDGSLVERLLATGAVTRDDHDAARSGVLPTARSGLVVDAGGGLSLRSAAYLGWRLPTLNELFRPFRVGADATAANPLLKPERLAGVEAGGDLRRGPVTIALTAFANRLSDAIANVTLGEGPGVFPGVGFVAAGGEYHQRQNIRAIRVTGVEASAQAKRGPWTARLGASLTNARVVARAGSSALDGLRPAQVPSLTMTGALGWADGARSASIELHHVGAQFDDDRNLHRLPPATTFDAFAAWPLAHNLQLVARAENVLDARVVAGIGGDGAVEIATPRTLWLGLRFGEPTGNR